MPSEDKDLPPWGGEGKVIALNKKNIVRILSTARAEAALDIKWSSLGNGA